MPKRLRRAPNTIAWPELPKGNDCCAAGKGIRAQFKPACTGAEAMLGKTANALSHIDPAGGRVFVEGETWNAVSAAPVETGQAVEITGMTGLTLKVKPKN